MDNSGRIPHYPRKLGIESQPLQPYSTYRTSIVRALPMNLLRWSALLVHDESLDEGPDAHQVIALRKI